MILTLMLLAAAPSAEAEALGLRLAQASTIASMMPLIARREAEELVEAHPELSGAEKDTLRATAAEVEQAQAKRLLDAMSHAFAESLSLDDLRALVAAAESPAGAHLRAAQPQILRAVAASAGKIDFKGETMAAFCKKTGTACAR